MIHALLSPSLGPSQPSCHRSLGLSWGGSSVWMIPASSAATFLPTGQPLLRLPGSDQAPFREFSEPKRLQWERERSAPPEARFLEVLSGSGLTQVHALKRGFTP